MSSNIKDMITSIPSSVLPVPSKSRLMTHSWHTGILLLLFCLILAPGCGDAKSRKAAEELKKELEGLKSDSAIDRENSLLHLSGMGAAAKPAAPKAVELLKDPEIKVKTAAIQLIVSLKHKDPGALAEIGALAASAEDDELRGNALNALMALDANEEHAKACAELLGSKDERLRELGSQGLAQANEHAEVVKTQLVAGLDDELPYVRANCATALGNIGSKAPPEAKDKLTALLKDKEQMVADEAKKALEKIE